MIGLWDGRTHQWVLDAPGQNPAMYPSVEAAQRAIDTMKQRSHAAAFFVAKPFSPVEEYLDQFDALEGFAKHSVDAADYLLLGVSRLMRVRPREALAAITSVWPSADYLSALITEALSAEERLARCWSELPEKYRNAMPSKSPDEAGGIDLGEREFDEVKEAFLERWQSVQGSR